MLLFEVKYQSADYYNAKNYIVGVLGAMDYNFGRRAFNCSIGQLCYLYKDRFGDLQQVTSYDGLLNPKVVDWSSFEEKYPFEIGDMVSLKNGSQVVIEKVALDDDDVVYMCDDGFTYRIGDIEGYDETEEEVDEDVSYYDEDEDDEEEDDIDVFERVCDEINSYDYDGLTVIYSGMKKLLRFLYDNADSDGEEQAFVQVLGYIQLKLDEREE